jgi:thiol-disulfide isomerase/thioredoxin
VALLALLGCEEKTTPTAAPQERSQSVVAAPGAAPAPAPSPVASAAAPAAPKQVLCAQQLGKPAKDVPDAAISRAGEASKLAEKLPTGDGWTWINLWAAWCVPCKEEIPRLKSWEKQTAGERSPLKVLFVSLDDDERQLQTFLAAQPATGLRSTYWLKDGPERAAWLKQAGMDGEPELPAHLLVDPKGKVRCKQQGAIEDTDFVEVQKILRGQRGGHSPASEGDHKHGHKPEAKAGSGK